MNPSKTPKNVNLIYDDYEVISTNYESVIPSNMILGVGDCEIDSSEFISKLYDYKRYHLNNTGNFSDINLKIQDYINNNPILIELLIKNGGGSSSVINHYSFYIDDDKIAYYINLPDLIDIINTLFGKDKISLINGVLCESVRNDNISVSNGEYSSKKNLNNTSLMFHINDDKNNNDGFYILLEMFNVNKSHNYLNCDYTVSDSIKREIFEGSMFVDYLYTYANDYKKSNIYSDIINDEIKKRIDNNSINLCINKNEWDKKPNFNVIISTQQGLDLHSLPIESDVHFPMDLHYHNGSEFCKWYNSLVYTLKHKNNGLCLFHGYPGTGKTYLIKRLSYDLRKSHRFILMKESVFTAINGPNFQSFLINHVIPIKKEGMKTMLVLEDNESMLQKQANDVRSSQMSTLLNITDGIDGDMYNLQVISSFNTKNENIDSAMYRHGRIITDMEFELLDSDEANRLFEYVKDKRDIEGSFDNYRLLSNTYTNEHCEVMRKRFDENQYTVSDVYAMVDLLDNDLLSGHTKTLKNNNKPIGFNLTT